MHIKLQSLTKCFLYRISIFISVKVILISKFCDYVSKNVFVNFINFEDFVLLIFEILEPQTEIFFRFEHWERGGGGIKNMWKGGQDETSKMDTGRGGLRT